ncbi:LysR family transcriptional regulator [Luteimonas aquatica]|uniref:LysR family transcriptional regulator n=1 Tax=Luteimonas aquatica TaxID=450364 RepID=UPI001F5601C7|nr:LysR family transcriptional regulator [Luteimonas aquatica]
MEYEAGMGACDEHSMRTGRGTLIAASMVDDMTPGAGNRDMIDSLPNLVTFDRIVMTGSLSAAARELGLSQTMISKRLTKLEAGLGVRLLRRTTRRQALTGEGVLFHAQVQRILAEVHAAEALMSDCRGSMGGLLKMAAPVDFGRRWLAPIAGEFQRQHPQLRIQLNLVESVDDFAGGDLDMAVRFGNLEDASLISQSLAPDYHVLCASPAYLSRHGTPHHPTALAAHRCILIGAQPQTEWRFRGEENVAVRVTGAMITNDGTAAVAWALDGAGIVLKSIWDVSDAIDDGRLRRVLPAYWAAAAPLRALYPSSGSVAPKIRAFVDHLHERLNAAWSWGSHPD